MSIRSKIVFVSIFFAGSAASVSAQDAAELCKLLPANPTILLSRTSEVPLYAGGCMGGYWARLQGAGVFYDLHEFGATMMIWPDQTPESAKILAAKYQQGRPPTDTYGDAAWETMEDPAAQDAYVRDSRSLQNRVKARETIESRLSARPYFVIFTCGRFIASVTANPSRGADTRSLVKELDFKLKQAGLCASGATNSAPDPVKSEKPEYGYKVFGGETGRQIKEWANRNARYIVVLDRHWDPQQGCWIEERAFTGGIRGSDADQVSVSVGPSKTFCLNGSVFSVEQVNSAQDAIATARDRLAKALETDERQEIYLKNHHADAKVRAEYNLNQQWIDYYKKFIANYESQLANSIPPQ